MFNNFHTNAPQARYARQQMRIIVRNSHAEAKAAADVKRERKQRKRLKDVETQQMGNYKAELRHPASE